MMVVEMSVFCVSGNKAAQNIFYDDLNFYNSGFQNHISTYSDVLVKISLLIRGCFEVPISLCSWALVEQISFSPD